MLFYDWLRLICDDREAAKRLLQEEPELMNLRSSSTRETALHYFAIENEPELVYWLIENGADVNSLDAGGSTPLICACQLGYQELTCDLLQYGATTTQMNRCGFSALSAAARSGDWELFQMVLAHCDAEDINVYFDDPEAEDMLDKPDGPIVDELKRRGLKRRWEPMTDLDDLYPLRDPEGDGASDSPDASSSG